MRSPSETLRSRPQIGSPAELGPQDTVIVATKAPALPAVAAAIAPLLGPDTPVLFALNGVPWWYFHHHGGTLDGRRLPLVDPDDAVWNAIGPQRALGGVVYSACSVTAPGEVQVDNATNRLVLTTLLDQFERRYGAKAATDAEALIKVQRLLAISHHAGRADSAEVADLERQADDLRRDIGLFAMMWLRSHLPVDVMSAGLWSHLDETVAAGDESVDGEIGAPMTAGLWARLGEVTDAGVTPEAEPILGDV